MNSCTSTELSACAPPFRYIHHRHGQRIRGRVARISREIFVERLPGSHRRGARRSHRNRQNRVRAEFRFVRRAISFDHAPIERALIGRVHAGHRFRDSRVDVPDGFQHALAEVARFVAVAKFVGFVLAGRSAGRNRGAAERAAFQTNIRFDCRIAARIDNFAPVNRTILMAVGIGSRSAGLRTESATGT